MTAYQDTPKENNLASRVGQLSQGATARTAGPPSLLGSILDNNGNMLAGMDQINGRLWSILEKMTGPQPHNAMSEESDAPQGSLHTVIAQQNIMNQKQREMLATIEQIEQLM